ncbi:cytochrome P450 [Carbonactinospora thermoautotrophica]|uniref:Cytochrome P450 n=1 Tax=Carbonactinospora thermoautotrophica TaxID=1469144 RepID=A0A132MVN4_9ACTN|nr:cytochrome P450 [Carbonactinospora thermoautotrophica]KWX01965.1 Cytochrome P450 [Carbonactinospora thermoautotrophica]MCX9189902.1 cytochrome P450 [Carbonactinospora thermoautotrophica]
MTVFDELPALPFDRPDLLRTAPLFHQLQKTHPITPVRTPAGDVGWLVTRYEDVKTLLADRRLGRSHPDPDQAARFSNSAFLGGPTGNYTTEEEDHARLRRLMTRSFTARRMEMLRPRVQALVDELLDELERQAPPADFHETFSFPLPVLVICELLGVPYEDRQVFRTWADESAEMFDGTRAAAAYQQLAEYMYGLIERKRRHPGEDVISDLVAARDERGQLSEDEMIQLAVGLLFAGHETTVARIDFGVLLLLTHPEQRAALQADPSLVPRTVEEILRVAAPSQGVIPRYARADIEIGGVTIRAGDLVLLALEPANRDEAVFPEPDRFDVTREQNPHVMFGHGPRFCAGASLARVELQAVFGTLFWRFPTLRLAVPLEELRLRDSLLTGGLEALPVTW